MVTDPHATQFSSADLPRRRLLTGLMTAAGGGAALGASTSLEAQPATGPSAAPAPQWNVLDFGATGDGKADNTPAFQTALDTAGAAGGGLVFAPAGRYRFHGTLRVPRGVTLGGTCAAVSSHSTWDVHEEGNPPGHQCMTGAVSTTLMPTAGRGQEHGDPFILLHANSTLRGVVVWHVEQDPTTEPVPYPWTIAMREINSAVLDVELVNPYQGIDVQCNRPYIRGVVLQALRRGIWIDKMWDVGRIADVHCHALWNNGDTVTEYMLTHAEAFIIGRTDWLYMANCFVYGHHIGYHFVDAYSNVVLTQCGGNDGGPIAVQVDKSIATWGNAFSNSQLSGKILVTASNEGPLKFNNCGFDSGLELAGRGHVTFTGCDFLGGGIQAQCPVTVTGCDLRGNPIAIAATVPAAVIMGNQRVGTIADASTKAQILGNTTS